MGKWKKALGLGLGWAARESEKRGEYGAQKVAAKLRRVEI